MPNLPPHRPPPIAADPKAVAPGDRTLDELLVHIQARRNRARRRLFAAEHPGGADLTARRRGQSPDGQAAAASPRLAGNRPASQPPRAGEDRLAPAAPQRTMAAAAGGGAAPGTVLAFLRLSADLLQFAVARPPGLAFSPGQSVRLGLGGIRRRYSLVSAPHEPALEFFVELIPGGRMSAHLGRLRMGQRVEVDSGPKGGLTLDAKATRHLMLATVTGVNPFVSMLRDAVHRGRRDLGCVLVHGASFADEFGYRAELEALAAARPDMLAYVPTVSRPGEARNAGWTGARGRADAHLDAVIQRFSLSPATTTVYACGNPGMVGAAKRCLGGRGFRVLVEAYD